MDRRQNDAPHKRLAAGLVAVALAVALATLLAPVSRSATFPDLAGEPEAIHSAVDYATEMGYMEGYPDGYFYPREGVSRMEYARATVRIFKNLDDTPDSSITFTDVASGSEDYRYANIAVKRGYIDRYGDGSFRPDGTVPTINALAGLVEGLELDDQVYHAGNLYPRGPFYGGYSILAHDLRLKYRNTGTWPDHPYPRGEMAYSLQMVDCVEQWRLDYVRSSFDWLHCQTPWVGERRRTAMDSAFSKLGYPYVWAGESDSEGGYDCSGLTYFVLGSVLGYPMMRTAHDQAHDSRYRKVAREDLLAGDPIFFFSSDGDGTVGHAAMYVGQDLFIHSTGSNAGVSVDRLCGYWEDQFAWGTRVIPEPEPETFDTYVLLLNPNEAEARADLVYMLTDGRNLSEGVTLEPYSRKTVKVDRRFFDQEVSVFVQSSGAPIVAERSMYFMYGGRIPGGHSSPGVTQPSESWYLPEGCTAWGFDTYLLVQNPGPEASQVDIKFMNDNGRTVEMTIEAGPLSRRTVAVDSVPGMEEEEFATAVTASRPVVVERSMYFDYAGGTEGHNSPGITQLSRDWYMAEGYTGQGFDTYVLLANPSSDTAAVTVTLQDDSGESRDVEIDLEGESRHTLVADDLPGWEDREFSVAVHADVPIGVERSMYFDYRGIRGGHSALACPAPAVTWYLAEGYTGGSFDTYILLSNPGDSEERVSARFMVEGQGAVEKTYTVQAGSRYTIPVDEVEGLSSCEVSALITSEGPIIAERSMYFCYGTRPGGTCCPGVSRTSSSWYFAEGYTGK